jgi:galactose-1-phosphate uridylyltransferase
MYEIEVLQKYDKQLLNTKEYVIFIYFVMFVSASFFKFSMNIHFST